MAPVADAGDPVFGRGCVQALICAGGSEQTAVPARGILSLAEEIGEGDSIAVTACRDFMTLNGLLF